MGPMAADDFGRAEQNVRYGQIDAIVEKALAYIADRR